MTLKFLIVDDNPIDILINRRVIQNLLGEAEVASFLAPIDVLDFYEKSEDDQWPHVILLDIRMPIMNGFALFDMLYKRHPEHIEKALVVMVSSSLDPEDLQRAKETKGIDGFIDKPLRKDNLERLLGSHKLI